MSLENEISVVLTDQEVGEMLTLYKEKEKVISVEIEKLKEKHRAILTTISKLSNRSSEKKSGSYDIKSNWIVKIIYALKRANKPLKTKDIVELIYNIESELLYNVAKRDKYYASISAIIPQYLDEDKPLRRYRESEHDDYLIGLKEWSNDKFTKC